MMKAVIFDMDGVLVDSEPVWRHVETQVFKSLGVPITEADCGQTTGLRIDDVVAHWRARTPWQGADNTMVVDQIIDQMVAAMVADPRPLPGAVEAVLGCVEHVPVAVATSSPARLARPILEALGLWPHLTALCSAEAETHGKPHPAVYLRAAHALKVPAIDCLAVEDSVTGLISAKAARMTCIVIPAPESRMDPRFGLADTLLHSLTEWDWAMRFKDKI